MPKEKKQVFTREEVISLVDEAFWAGIEEGGIDYAGEAWIAESFVDRRTE